MKPNLYKEIEQTKKNIRVGSNVKVVRDNNILKTGRVVKLTTAGAHIYNENNRYLNPKRGQDYDVLPETAEWFSFENFDGRKLVGGIILT